MKSFLSGLLQKRTWLCQPLFDTATYPKDGTVTLSFFENPIGVKSAWDTNMVESKRIPFKVFQLHGISFSHYGFEWNIIEQIAHRGLFSFDIGSLSHGSSERHYLEMPLDGLLEIYRLSVPLTLYNFEHMDIKCLWNIPLPIAKDGRLRVFLHGIYRREP